MMKSVHQQLLLAIVVLMATVVVAKSDPQNQQQQQKQQTDKLRAQSRQDSPPRKSHESTSADMHSVYQQHLIGPNIASAVVSHDSDKSQKKDIWSRFGSKSDGNSLSSNHDGKRGRLQQVGSVIGDIIGVLVSEIARFFGSVVSDVAREVTAHGFVSLFKQIADLTGLSLPGHHHQANNVATPQMS